MAEEILRARLAKLAGMHGAFLDDAEYRLCRGEAVKAYGEMLRRAPTHGLPGFDTAPPGIAESGSSNAKDIVSQLSAGARRELGDAVLAHLDGGAAAWKKRIGDITQKVLKERERAAGDASPTAAAAEGGNGVATGSGSGADHLVNLKDVLPDIIAAVSAALPDDSRSDLVGGLASAVDTADAKAARARRARGGATKRKRDEGAAAADGAGGDGDTAATAGVAGATTASTAHAWTAEQIEYYHRMQHHQASEVAAAAAAAAAKEISIAAVRDDQPPPPPPREEAKSAAQPAPPPPPPKRAKKGNTADAPPAAWACDICGQAAAAAGECEVCGGPCMRV